VLIILFNPYATVMSDMIIDNKIIWMLGNYPIRINNRKAYTFILEIFWKEESKTNINKDKISAKAQWFG